MAKLKGPTVLAIALLCAAGGVGVGYKLQSNRHAVKEEPRALARLSSPEAPPGSKPDSPGQSSPAPLAPSLAASGTGRTGAAPAATPLSAPNPRSSKIQKLAALFARMTKTAQTQGKSVNLNPKETAELFGILSDPKCARLLENAGNHNWREAQDFMFAYIEELGVHLREDQKAALERFFSKADAPEAQGDDSKESSIDKSLREIRGSKALLDQLTRTL